jgi:TetR/AcrR family fatty acid metabolism transcriptional regulator
VVYRTTPKMAQRKEANRARILETAIHLFGAQGYHATTVPDIVRDSGSSNGAFYLYFRNKEDVFAVALQLIGDQVSAALNQAIAAAGENAISQMRAAVEALIHYLAAHPHEARVLIVESSSMTPRLAQVRRSIIASHCRSVEQALTALAGSLPRFDPHVVATCWVGAVHEAVFQWLETPKAQRTKTEALAREVSSFNLRAIGAGDPA